MNPKLWDSSGHRAGFFVALISRQRLQSLLSLSACSHFLKVIRRSVSSFILK